MMTDSSIFYGLTYMGRRMSMSDIDRAFAIVRAARDSKKMIFFKKSRTIIVISGRSPNRYSVNTVLGFKNSLEQFFNISTYICGGGYGCFRFEIGSDDEGFSLSALSDLFTDQLFIDYIHELGVSEVRYRGGVEDANSQEEELLYSSCST